MNNRNFVSNIIELYHEARKPRFPSSKIRRGRSHPISSQTEDLFASYLVDKIKCDAIYVDQPISVMGFKTAIYPDITIIRKGKIVAFCDLKMDLGWKRQELYDFCRKHTKLLKKIRGKECKLRDGTTKEDKYYSIHKRASLNILIISNQNINQVILKNHVKRIKLLGATVEVFILTEGEHPNAYGISGQKLLKKIKINKDAFEALIKKLK